MLFTNLETECTESSLPRKNSSGYLYELFGGHPLTVFSFGVLQSTGLSYIINYAA